MSTWYYYNEDGNKIEVTGGQLKELAKQGMVTRDTIVETEEGKSGPARRVKGLAFLEATQPESGQEVAPSKTKTTTSKWFYYNENGDKIEVTGSQLKGLAKAGMITPGTLVETEDGKKALAKTVKGLTFIAAATAATAVLATGANPFTGSAVPLRDNPFSAPMQDIAANATGTIWFADLVQNEHVQKGVKKGVKSFFKSDGSSANNRTEFPNADYGVAESVDSYDFDGSEIANTDGSVMDFLGGFFD